ncbi:BsuBI/PstI family type II restriction endonuclease [Patulibacter sp. S7RM1-6]
MSFRPLPSLAQCSARLEAVFPRTAFDSTLSNPLAAAAAAAMIYVDAIVDDDSPAPDDVWVRPTTCLWLSDDIYARHDDDSRAAWRSAALGSNAKRRVIELQQSWGLAFNQRYGDNTRETLRDETLPQWLELGAARTRPGVATTSPLPRWALSRSFADLFDPTLEGNELTAALDAWRDARMNPMARTKALVAQQRLAESHAVEIVLPNGVRRSLEPGDASAILKGVIETWAPRRLVDPVVLTVSEPGDKIYTADAAILQRLGLKIDASTLLPDALLVDVGAEPVDFWMIEAVATDGPITERRKRELLEWARKQRIPTESCKFLTAFVSRNAGPAKRRLKDLAAGTFAWYLDEPGNELSWYEIVDQQDPL